MLSWEEWKVGAEDDQHDVDWEYMFSWCDADNSGDITQTELQACQGTIDGFRFVWNELGNEHFGGGSEVTKEDAYAAIANLTDS